MLCVNRSLRSFCSVEWQITVWAKLKGGDRSVIDVVPGLQDLQLGLRFLTLSCINYRRFFCYGLCYVIRVFMNDELEGTWKDSIVAYFKLLVLSH
jgi:hypothetical protein